MPHPSLPPTPTTSREIAALEKHPSLESASFELPPSAMSSLQERAPADQRTADPASTSKALQPSPPVSPARRPPSASPRHKRTLSGTAKIKGISSTSEMTATPSPEFTLPPPPQRTRKIIQMNPKGGSQPSSSGASPGTSKPAAATTSSPPKRKQPSSTSAAGRKIARKTAHSIIERRRRSKMNEEFAVLKGMIPACVGQEMHKLAILQAGIDYMRYLEDCIGELKGRKGRDDGRLSCKRARHRGEEDEEEEDDDEDEVESKSPKTTRGPTRTSSITFEEASPYLAPLLTSSSRAPDRHNSLVSANSSSASASTSRTSTPRMTPTQTHLTPSFGAVQFSPKIPSNGYSYSHSHSHSHSHSPYVLPSSNTSYTKSTTPQASPNILPLPALSSIMDLDQHPDHEQEATATAALMMLTHDRRGFRERDGNGNGGAKTDVPSEKASEKKERLPSIASKGMSVKELLTT